MFFKNIADIQLKNNAIVTGRKFEKTAGDFENEIRDLDYNGNGLKKDKAVENANIPNFAQVFYYKIYSRLAIPTQEEFLKTYFDSFVMERKNGNILIENSWYSEEGVKSRMLRTYPSLIRDFHFYLLAENSEKFDQVRFSLYRDVAKGLDLEVKYKGHFFYISLYIDTKRSREFKIKKGDRHDYSQVVEIEMPVKFRELREVGRFYLLGKEHVKLLIERIDKYVQG